MKCPECSNNHRYRDGMRCKCGYQFALDPGVSPRLADGFFVAAISLASVGGTYRFTENQLYAASRVLIRRKLGPWRLLVLPFFLGFVGAGFAVFYFLDFIENNAIHVGLVGILLLSLFIHFVGMFRPRKRRVWDERAVDTWRAKNKPIPGLIESPALANPPPRWNESDIYAYGVQRILICQRDELVDLFVLNGFHSQNGCVVVSESGYPLYVAVQARNMLAENEAMKVFLFHDATAVGGAMEERLRSAGRFDLSRAEVFDLGIAPTEIKKSRRMRAFAKANGGTFPADGLLYGKLAAVLPRAMDEVLTVTAIDHREEREQFARDSGSADIVTWTFNSESSSDFEIEVDWDGDSDGSGGEGDGE